MSFARTDPERKWFSFGERSALKQEGRNDIIFAWFRVEAIVFMMAQISIAESIAASFLVEMGKKTALERAFFG